MAERVVAEIAALNRPYAEAQAHRLLGDLLRPVDRDRAATHLGKCLELEAPFGYPDVRASCLWSLALLEVSQNPPRAEQLSREAIRLASANAGGILLPFAWQARLRLVWHTLPQAQAISESFAALDAIERLRARQGNNAARAALFHTWTRDYYWLTGRLLQSEPPQVERAFEVGERLRARVLLEHLALAGVTRAAHDDDRGASRQQLARSISDRQRRLLAPELTNAARRALLDQLELLELERAELGDGDVPAADAAMVSFASLDAVQRALHPGEAMLWFSLGAWKDLYDDFGGGAWVLVVLRDGVRLHRLDTPVALDSQVAALTGLLRQRETPEASWAAAAQTLGRTLLAACARRCAARCRASHDRVRWRAAPAAVRGASKRQRVAVAGRAVRAFACSLGHDLAPAASAPGRRRRQAPRWCSPIPKCRVALRSAAERSIPCRGPVGKRPQSFARSISTTLPSTRGALRPNGS